MNMTHFPLDSNFFDFLPSTQGAKDVAAKAGKKVEEFGQGAKELAADTYTYLTDVNKQKEQDTVDRQGVQKFHDNVAAKISSVREKVVAGIADLKIHLETVGTELQNKAAQPVSEKKLIDELSIKIRDTKNAERVKNILNKAINYHNAVDRKQNEVAPKATFKAYAITRGLLSPIRKVATLVGAENVGAVIQEATALAAARATNALVRGFISLGHLLTPVLAIATLVGTIVTLPILPFIYLGVKVNDRLNALEETVANQGDRILRLERENKAQAELFFDPAVVRPSIFNNEAAKAARGRFQAVADRKEHERLLEELVRPAPAVVEAVQNIDQDEVYALDLERQLAAASRTDETTSKVVEKAQPNILRRNLGKIALFGLASAAGSAAYVLRNFPAAATATSEAFSSVFSTAIPNSTSVLAS